jgi:hypothetical protein
MLLPLRSVSDDRLKPAAESTFSVCCVLTQPNTMSRSANGTDKIQSCEYMFYAFPFFIASCLAWLVYLMVSTRSEDQSDLTRS